MTEQGMKLVVSKLITDENFKKEFFADPDKAIENSGYHVSLEEIKALKNIKAEDLKFNPKGAAASKFTIITLDVKPQGKNKEIDR